MCSLCNLCAHIANIIVQQLTVGFGFVSFKKIKKWWLNKGGKQYMTMLVLCSETA